MNRTLLYILDNPDAQNHFFVTIFLCHNKLAPEQQQTQNNQSAAAFEKQQVLTVVKLGIEKKVENLLYAILHRNRHKITPSIEIFNLLRVKSVRLNFLVTIRLKQM